ncbi:MAG: hypothetical protein ACREMB_17130 [Candidatus Rokuibacteriota bacterium]
MPEDSTRRLLRAFGVAVTDCEDALAALTAALRDPGGATTPTAALEAYGKAAADVSARWAELSRLILEYHTRAQEAVQGYLRAGGGPAS